MEWFFQQHGEVQGGTVGEGILEDMGIPGEEDEPVVVGTGEVFQVLKIGEERKLEGSGEEAPGIEAHQRGALEEGFAVGGVAMEDDASLAVQGAMGDEHDLFHGQDIFLFHAVDGGLHILDGPGKPLEFFFILHDFVFQNFFQQVPGRGGAEFGEPAAGNGKFSQGKKFRKPEDLVQSVVAVAVFVLETGGEDAMVVVINERLPVDPEELRKFCWGVIFSAFHGPMAPFPKVYSHYTLLRKPLQFHEKLNG